MKLKLIPATHELIADMRELFQINKADPEYSKEEPLRAELFSADQMGRLGKTLAGTHKLSTQPAQDHLLKRLADNGDVLKEVHKLLTESIRLKYQIIPAGEWLMDNYYLIEEHIRIAKTHFPKNYSENLPQLAQGAASGRTRIYDLVLQIISHSDGKIDLESLGSFLSAYQSVTNLRLGELWAVPIMLRLALIENIRRVAAHIGVDKIDRNLADYWAKQMIETAEQKPEDLILVIADMVRSKPPMVSAFVSELVRQLRGKGPSLELVLTWIEQQLSGIGLTSAGLVNDENQKQATEQVSMSNSIGSLRTLGKIDWRIFVEKQSIVEQILREDTGDVYSSMDFATRDRYRHVIEYLAQNSESSEQDVARIAIQLAKDSVLGTGRDERAAHVGYYLIDNGLIETRKLSRMKPGHRGHKRRRNTRVSFPFYLAVLVCTTAVLTDAILMKTWPALHNWSFFVFIGVLLLICISQLTISVINFFSTLLVHPDLLPRMDFSKAIPANSSTMVVIPSMLSSVEGIEQLLEALEVRFLANRKEHIYYGLLTDFTDSTAETLIGDKVLAAAAEQGIKTLNAKYGRETGDLFYLFHRPRLWNKTDKIWMGFERKRGKLGDLNALLRGGAKERFSMLIGDQSVFPQIKYVITLDSDTQLPLGAAGKLIGSMAHPLNKPWYNEAKKRVTKGYGILQPRVTVSLPDTGSSIYTRMHGNEPGIDPYTRASSDVYQDLFGEGSYIGKGIYEVDIFQKVLEGVFLDNRILSHDLLEGCYIRSGLVSDVQLFEKYPATYHADVVMRLRWVRGDWQIFAWFLPFVRGANGKLQKNPISSLSRWKIFDNIRRSLVPVALTVLLLLSWFVVQHTVYLTIAVSIIIIFPIFITSLWDAISKPEDVVLKQHFHNAFQRIGEVFTRTLFTIICLPYEAYCNITAIIRTLWRLLITGKKLLEWNPSSSAAKNYRSGLAAAYSYMWIQPVMSGVVLVALIMYAPAKLMTAGIVLALWVIAPFITWFISKDVKKQVAILTPEQYIFLQKLARKTWSFFEQFVVASENWLPPDNFQQQPTEQIAHRTSPTNIGLSLLSTVTARDFGYITTTQLIDRTRNTLDTMNKMERFKGHFYNWYDTGTLNPLLPKYVSTVDSGNLAGHLLVLRQALLAIPNQQIIDAKTFEGIRDTVRVLADTLKDTEKELLLPFTTDLETACIADISNIYEIKKITDGLVAAFCLLSGVWNADTQSEMYWWSQLLKKQLTAVTTEMELFAPWFLLVSKPEIFNQPVSANKNFTLTSLLSAAQQLRNDINLQLNSCNADEKDGLTSLKAALTNTVIHTQTLIASAIDLARQCDVLADMEWDFLYDTSNHLFTIGYHVQEHLADGSFYDLLASEVRLGIFTAIAQGKMPEESWFALGRLLTNVDGEPILLSWSGSMFEYLMPELVMPAYENTLISQTNTAAVAWQIKYGKKAGLPWGISESCYNMLNADSSYQYRAFGAPGLGLKRGLEEDAVIAPYASVMALMVAPEQAVENLEILAKKGLEGKYGMYEAVDYTPSRLQHGQSSAIIYSFMSHHHGMSLLSLSYLLHDKPLQKLFEAEPRFKATLLLLQERIPKATTFYAHTTGISDTNYVATGQESRIINTPDTPIPEVQLLSNGRYHVMITNAGGGYSRWKDIAVTRWREDSTMDNWGGFCFIRDADNDTYWSNTYQPTLQLGEGYEAAFTQGRVDFHQGINEIESHTEIVVSPEDDIEMRRVIITNKSAFRKTIEVTSYAEVVLANAASDIIQPAFSNLFVQTEIIPDQHTILCTRRPRSEAEQTPWMFHLMTIEGKRVEEESFETDRMAFIGRGNTIERPKAMETIGPLSGGHGSVLDPIVAIRKRILLEADETVTIDIVTGIAETRDACQGLIDKYDDNKTHKDRVFEMSWTHSQVVLRQINATEEDAQLYSSLASSVLYTNAAVRAAASVIINNVQQQSGLWGYSISGDLPIVLLKIEKQVNMQLVKQMIQAHAYWRLKGLVVDLVIWNEEQYSYRQSFQNEIQSLIPEELRGHKGGIFVRASDQLSNDDRILFQTVARVVISDTNGTLAEQIKRKLISPRTIPYIVPVSKDLPVPDAIPLPKDLVFFNGLGGFSADGSEYVININHKSKTPAPWVNVIANDHFGTVVSESGSAYTWTENAHELRLTPWNNDPVCDQGGEAFYLRDEESGHFWSTTLLPAGGASSYITRHGFGYSAFEHIEDGIHSEMMVFADRDAAVKFTVIKLRNQSGRARKLSATGYTEWVLGDVRSKTTMHIHTEVSQETGAIFGKNPYNTEFARRVAFFDVDATLKTYTADRNEFIGRNGNLRNPDAMSRMKLSGRVGVALDPCAAIQVPFELADGEELEITFRLGAGRDFKDANEMVAQFKGGAAAQEALDKVKSYWKQTIGAIHVETPDAAVNMMANGWLTYQTISARLWGRSGFYQSGGAFGFRDQLQDVLSLLYTTPQLARKQILLCASRQFAEGDVQHWWHPPVGRGVRTRISDDYLWLPFVTAQYIAHTGDTAILDEQVHTLEGRLLNADEESYFDLPAISGATTSLYSHCTQAIRHALVYGEHGLPLMGTGDWNDGLDRVGAHGKGESVWLAFFLYDVLVKFAPIAELYHEPAFATTCTNEALQLKNNIDNSAWDGAWYKRAWFDDGTPIGSATNEECRIDSIAQSWSVLSGAGDKIKAITAMNSAYEHLVQHETGIIKLLEPAFDKTHLNPGYIKGYVPGVRENGGQYTHAAVWMIMAFARLGEPERVWELLQMINPVNHGNTADKIAIYKVEPYVLAADIYSREPHAGRGGWTWYTGSAGWFYRLIIESFLGMYQEGDKLMFQPCVPKEWKAFKVQYRYIDTVYNIEIKQTESHEKEIISIDGVVQNSPFINLVNDKVDHHIQAVCLMKSS